MAYITMNAYDSVLRVPSWKGLYQSGDGFSSDPRYATEAVNVLTRDGYMRPVAPCELFLPELPAPIETFARLYRRWHTEETNHDVLIAACAGQLYWMLPNGSAWTQMALPAGWNGTGYQCSTWSYVAYEMNPEGSDAPVDVLLMSNAKDGMICVRGDNMTVSVVNTPKKFGVIARHAERIWGGAIDNDPDMLVYSSPFDPFNWQQNDEIPEDGAGDLKQPSWDGDSFTALTPFGDQLIALKRTRVWRIMGTNPGEYVFNEQYGGGTPYAKTVAVDGTRILMLNRDGVLQYNGESVGPYYQEFAQNIWARMNKDSLDEATACIWRNVYYLALPLDGAKANNAVLMYNTEEQTWLLRDDVSVESFLPTEEALYFTSSTTPGKVWQWKEDCQEALEAQPMRWVSPWFDLNYKNMLKGGFTVYLTVETETEATLNISIQTEKKQKTKTVTFTAPAAGREAKQRRLSFGGNGRRFRFIIESDTLEPWKLLGGLQIEAETDSD